MRKGKYVREGIFGPEIDSPADEIVNDAWDAESPLQAVKLARKALTIDLNAIDAYNILGLHAPTLAERIALFREAVSVGEKLFAPSFEDAEMAWWGFMGTRPWMRAQHNLGLALMEAGDSEEAHKTFKRLLALNPNDNQGIRTLVLKIAAESGDYGQCSILFADYPGDIFPEFPATEMLVDIATKKKIDFERHFAAIDASNGHLLPLLATAARSGRWPRAPRTDMVAFGSKEAAAIYLQEFKKAWTRKPNLLAGFLSAYDARRATAAGKKKDRT